MKKLNQKIAELRRKISAEEALLVRIKQDLWDVPSVNPKDFLRMKKEELSLVKNSKDLTGDPLLLLLEERRYCLITFGLVNGQRRSVYIRTWPIFLRMVRVEEENYKLFLRKYPGFKAVVNENSDYPGPFFVRL